MPSLLVKALSLTVFSLSLVGFPADAQAKEWEAFFARVVTNKFVVGWDGQGSIKSGADGLWIKSDGRYADTATGVGTAGSFDAYCNKYPKNCGRYEASGDRYTLYSNRGREPEVYFFSKINDVQGKLTADNVSYISLPPIPPDYNFRFNASYRALDDKVYGWVYTFEENGRITVSKPSSPSSGVKTGTYKIEGYSITFTFDNGEVDRRSFYILEKAPFMDGVWYEKVS